MTTVALSSLPVRETRSAFDESAWRALCTSAASQAQKGCGLSYDHYVALFSSIIDAGIGQMPEDQRAGIAYRATGMGLRDASREAGKPGLECEARLLLARHHAGLLPRWLWFRLLKVVSLRCHSRGAHYPPG